MFEVGLTELAMIALVALLVLGPEKLPRAARMAGLYVRKARASWHSIRSDIERELAAEDMKQAMRRAEDEMGLKDIRETLKETGRSLLEAPAPTSSAVAAAQPSPDPVPDPEPDSDTPPDKRP